MITAPKRFTIRRVGGEYEVEPELRSMSAEDVMTAAAGTLLAMYGLTRRDSVGGALVVAAGALVWQGFKGRRRLGKSILGSVRRLRFGWRNRGPSYPGENDRIIQRPQDEVDEASMESFPASDSPAR